jgi:hypothetical protein
MPHDRQSAGYRDAVRIEVLVVEGCPNAEPAVQLARAVAAEAGVDPQIEIVRINDLEASQAHRFSGSPSIRIDGADVEPGAERRTPSYGCRIHQGTSARTAFPTANGLSRRFARPPSRPKESVAAPTTGPLAKTSALVDAD